MVDWRYEPHILDWNMPSVDFENTEFASQVMSNIWKWKQALKEKPSFIHLSFTNHLVFFLVMLS